MSEKATKLKSEIESKKDELKKLKNYQNGIKADLFIIEEKLEQATERIAVRNNELNTRKRKLNELKKIAEGLKERNDSEQKDKGEVLDADIKAEKELKLKILKLISARPENNMDPSELFFFDGQKTEIKSNLVIHTVKIKLIQAPAHANKIQQNKIIPREATFRIDKGMKFDQLKKHACDHWMLNPTDYALYSLAFTPLEASQSNQSKNTDINEDKAKNNKPQGQTQPQAQTQPCETYFNKNNIYPEVWLIEKTSMLSAYVTKPEQYIDDPAANRSQGRSIKAQNLTKAQQELEKFKNTLEDYYHLKYYLPPVRENSDEAEVRRQHGRDTSCCAFLFLILLLATITYVITQRRNIEQEFWIREKVYRSLDPNRFYAIVDPTTAKDWINETISDAFFSGKSENAIYLFYDIVGPVVIRQVRSKEKSCLRSDLTINSTYKCYYFNTEGNEEYTETIGVGLDDWRIYYKDTGYKQKYTGEFGVYDTSGYLQEFSTDNMTSAEFRNTFSSMYSESWLASSTRAVFISANLYQPSYDLWVVVSIIIEISTNRLAFPKQLDVITVQPDLFGPTADIFKIIFSLYILYIYIGNILEIRDGRRNAKHAISFQGIMDLLLIVMVIFSVAISLWLNENTENILTEKKFIDFSALGNYYKLYHNINTMTLTLIIVRILLFFTLNKRVYILISTIQHSAKDVISFIIILALLVIAFSMIGQSLWGVHHHNYYSFIYSILNLLLISLGHGQFDKLIALHESWTILFIICYFLLLIFFLFSLFMAIYFDAYKITRLQEGYTDNATTWKKNDVLMWFVDWLPYAFKRKLFDKKEKKTDFEEDEEEKDEEEEKQE
ncbi:hypothetical protein SteCoe_20273 [Stentor coeruleus]|uniref:Uncharacterized protein n=1 Tax=Stentor coeruleus TaxID=5963 RepID=A0A1R2BS63_9CILI|nr:hypothetical protein SteCoe_20273 [Stentor coeruleus]